MKQTALPVLGQGIKKIKVLFFKSIRTASQGFFGFLCFAESGFLPKNLIK